MSAVQMKMGISICDVAAEYMIFVPDSTMTCMHCWFFKDHLVNAYEIISSQPQGNLPRALSMVNESLQYMNDPVQLVGNVN